MTEEEEELLLVDLSARLPYKVFCNIDDIDKPLELETIKFRGDYFIFNNGINERYITQIKPYLRPLSSMTEEEKDTYDRMIMCNAPWVVCDWLNSRHFDYRELIKRGLALEASEGMYN